MFVNLLLGGQIKVQGEVRKHMNWLWLSATLWVRFRGSWASPCDFIKHKNGISNFYESIVCVCAVWKTKTNSDRRKKRTRDNLVYWEYQQKSWEGTRKWEDFFLLPSTLGVFSSFLFNTFLTGVQVGQGLPEKPNRPPFDFWQGINRLLVEHIQRDGLKWERMWLWTKVYFF